MRRAAILASGLCVVSAAGQAAGQSTSITAGPNGELRGAVTTPGLPPVGVQAGGGAVAAAPQPPMATGVDAAATASDGRASTYAGPGRSLTVRSPNGSASSSVSVTGDNAVVAGAGSPGSRVSVSPGPVRAAGAHHRKHKHTRRK